MGDLNWGNLDDYLRRQGYGSGGATPTGTGGQGGAYPTFPTEKGASTTPDFSVEKPFGGHYTTEAERETLDKRFTPVEAAPAQPPAPVVPPLTPIGEKPDAVTSQVLAQPENPAPEILTGYSKEMQDKFLGGVLQSDIGKVAGLFGVNTPEELRGIPGFEALARAVTDIFGPTKQGNIGDIPKILSGTLEQPAKNPLGDIPNTPIDDIANTAENVVGKTLTGVMGTIGAVEGTLRDIPGVNVPVRGFEVLWNVVNELTNTVSGAEIGAGNQAMRFSDLLSRDDPTGKLAREGFAYIAPGLALPLKQMFGPKMGFDDPNRFAKHEAEIQKEAQRIAMANQRPVNASDYIGAEWNKADPYMQLFASFVNPANMIDIIPLSAFGKARTVASATRDLQAMPRVLRMLYGLPEQMVDEVGNPLLVDASKIGIKRPSTLEKLLPYKLSINSKAIDMLGRSMDRVNSILPDLKGDEFAGFLQNLADSSASGKLAKDFVKRYPGMNSVDANVATRLTGGFDASGQWTKAKESAGSVRSLLENPQADVKLNKYWGRVYESLKKNKTLDVESVLDVASKYELQGKWGKHIAKGIKETLGVTDPGVLKKFVNGIRAWEGALYIGLNPGTWVRNGLSNMGAMHLKGFVPWDNVDKIEATYKAIGWNPLGELFDLDVAQASRDVIAKTGSATAFGAELPKKLGGVVNVYENIENAHRRIVTYRAMDNWLKQNHRRGVSFKRMPKALEDSLRQLHPRYPELIYGAVEHSIDAASIRKAIDLSLTHYKVQAFFDNPEFQAELGRALGAQGRVTGDHVRAWMGSHADRINEAIAAARDAKDVPFEQALRREFGKISQEAVTHADELATDTAPMREAFRQQAARQDAGGMNMDQFMEGYFAGKGRGDTPEDLAYRQFYDNNKQEIESRFQEMLDAEASVREMQRAAQEAAPEQAAPEQAAPETQAAGGTVTDPLTGETRDLPTQAAPETQAAGGYPPNATEGTRLHIDSYRMQNVSAERLTETATLGRGDAKIAAQFLLDERAGIQPQAAGGQLIDSGTGLTEGAGATPTGEGLVDFTPANVADNPPDVPADFNVPFATLDRQRPDLYEAMVNAKDPQGNPLFDAQQIKTWKEDTAERLAWEKDIKVYASEDPTIEKLRQFAAAKEVRGQKGIGTITPEGKEYDSHLARVLNKWREMDRPAYTPESLLSNPQDRIDAWNTLVDYVPASRRAYQVVDRNGFIDMLSQHYREKNLDLKYAQLDDVVKLWDAVGKRWAIERGKTLDEFYSENFGAWQTRGGAPERPDSGFMAQIPVEEARRLPYATNLPTDPIFQRAVENTPGARLDPDGLILDMTRYQKYEQAGEQSVRTGVFYLPTGSENVKHYRKPTGPYGGPEKIQGETLVKNPLFVKGATGGKAPEVAYDTVLGKGAYQRMRGDAVKVFQDSFFGGRGDRTRLEARAQEFLDKYVPGADRNLAYNIVANSSVANQMAYALQEAAVADAVRGAGHDAVLGYSVRRDGTPFISEIFDVRETDYPTRSGDFAVHPDFLRQDANNVRMEIGDSQEVLPRLAQAGEKYDAVIIDPAYYSKMLVGGNRGINKAGSVAKWEFIMPEDFAKVMQSVSDLVRGDDSHVYLMLSGAPSAQADMARYLKGATDAGFQVVQEGGLTKTFRDGKPVTNVRGLEAAPEKIYLLTKSGNARTGETPINMTFKYERPSLKGYQTQKPNELMRDLIRQSTMPGESVLDPFSGSGVTGVEAINNGRLATLIDRNPDAINKFAKQNIEDARNKQLDLFQEGMPLDAASSRRLTDIAKQLDELGLQRDEARSAGQPLRVRGIEKQIESLRKEYSQIYKDARDSGALYQIDTQLPALRQWFGDSKVVDDSGAPKQVFHGTRDYGFEEFRKSDKGIFFSSREDVAMDYAYRSGIWRGRNENPQAYAVYLKIENPLVIDALGKRNDNIPVPWQSWKQKTFGRLPEGAVSVEDAAKYAKENGYDGLIVKNVVDTFDVSDKTKSDVYAVFEPTQVKSAIGNRGTFDPNNPNILAQPAEGGPKGQLSFIWDGGGADIGRALIELVENNSDVSTVMHESFHAWLMTLNSKDLDAIAKWGGMTDGAELGGAHRKYVQYSDLRRRKSDGITLTDEENARLGELGKDKELRAYKDVQEKWARGGEQFLAEGKAPIPELNSVFERFMGWFEEVYRFVKDAVNKYRGTPLDVNIESVRDVYKNLFDYENAISPALLKEIEDGVKREAATSSGAWHLKPGIFDAFFKPGTDEGRRIWQFTKATEGTGNWWYPVSSNGNLGTKLMPRFPEFVSALGPTKAQMGNTPKNQWKFLPGDENPEWADAVLEHYRQMLDLDQTQLQTIDDLKKLVMENVQHNNVTATETVKLTGEQRKARAAEAQARKAKKDQEAQAAQQPVTPETPAIQSETQTVPTQQFNTPEELLAEAMRRAQEGLTGKKAAPESASASNVDLTYEQIKQKYPNPTGGEGRDPWMMPADAWRGYEEGALSGLPGGKKPTEPTERAIAWHKGQVAKAVQDGKPVPAEVIAKYPDLAAKFAPAPMKDIEYFQGALRKSTDPNYSNDILRIWAKRATTDGELKQILDAVEPLESEIGSNAWSTAYDVSFSRFASKETKERALNLREEWMRPGRDAPEDEAPSPAPKPVTEGGPFGDLLTNDPNNHIKITPFEDILKRRQEQAAPAPKPQTPATPESAMFDTLMGDLERQLRDRGIDPDALTQLDPETQKLVDIYRTGLKVRRGEMPIEQALDSILTVFPDLKAQWDNLKGAKANVTERPQTTAGAGKAGEAASAAARTADAGTDAAAGTGDRLGLGRTDGGSIRGSAGNTERLVTARQQFTKPADTSRIPTSVLGKLEPHQQQGVAKAIDAMEQHGFDRGGFILADGTGAGKTRQELGIAAYFQQQGKPVVIVTASEVIKPSWVKRTISGSFLDDSRAMGLSPQLTTGEAFKPGQVYITTYDRLGDVRDFVTHETVVLFDEAHSLKNAEAIRSIEGAQITRQAKSVLFASATPADKPTHIDYMARAGIFEGKTRDQAYEDLGMRLQKIRVRGGRTISKWVVNPNVGAAEVYRRMGELFDRVTGQGLMVKREISMKGVGIEFKKIKLPPEAYELMNEIEAFILRGGTLNDAKGLQKANVLMQMRRQQETYKIPTALKMVQEELAADRKVVLFMSRVNQSAVGRWDKVLVGGQMERVRRTLMSSEGTAKLLRSELKKLGITDIAELHGAAELNAPEAMKQFQEGKAKVMIATVESGGTGINLDDVAGNAPRTLIMLTAPFSAVGNVQAAGRVWRLKTQSLPKIRYIFADTHVDDWNSGIIAAKMRMLGATVEGEVRLLDIPADLSYRGAVDYLKETQTDPDLELFQRGGARPKLSKAPEGQQDMFAGSNEDLPIVSGVAPRGQEELFNPQIASKQFELPTLETPKPAFPDQAKQVGEQYFPEWRGSAYRSPSGFTHNRETTAADVIRHEKEVGNDYGIGDEILKELETRPADDVIWVTKQKSDAARYGQPESEPLPAHSVILAEDGDGGFLVLKGGFENQTDQLALFQDKDIENAIRDWQNVPPEAGPQAADAAISEADLLNKALPILFKHIREANKSGAPALSSADPLAMQFLKKWLDDEVVPSLADTRLAATHMGHAAIRQTLLDYSRRHNYDEWLSYIFPFLFWRTESAKNWARMAIERPGLISNMVRAQQIIDDQTDDPRFPKRFKGRMRFALPFMEDWIGGNAYFDPMEPFFPVKSIFGAELQRAQYGAGGLLGFPPGNNDIANVLKRMAKDGEYSRSEVEDAIANKKGQLWEMAKQEAQQDNTSPDNLTSLFSPHTPIQWLMAGYTDGGASIGPLLPISRPIRQITGAAGLNNGSGLNIESPVRALLRTVLPNLPEFDPWEEYRVRRMLANMVEDEVSVDGKTITEKDAKLAMLEKRGAWWAEAARRANMEKAPFLNPVVPVQTFPTGEQGILNAKTQLRYLKQQEVRRLGGTPENMTGGEIEDYLHLKGGYGSDTPISQFYDSHPELGARTAVFEENETLLKQWVKDEIWAKYNEADPLNKRAIRAQLGDDFQRYFLSKDTRDYDQVELLDMIRWGQRIDALIPNVPKGEIETLDLARLENPRALQYAPPALAQKYTEFSTRIDSTFDQAEIDGLNDQYGELDTRKEKQEFLARYPQLDAYKKAWGTFYDNNPEIKAFLTQVGAMEPQALSTLSQSKEQQFYNAIVGAGLDWDAVQQKQDFYETLPKGTGARSAFLQDPRNQDYLRYYDLRNAFFGPQDGETYGGSGGGYSSGSGSTKRVYDPAYYARDVKAKKLPPKDYSTITLRFGTPEMYKAYAESRRRYYERQQQQNQQGEFRPQTQTRNSPKIG